MAKLAARVVGAMLALAGLALTVLGVWFAVSLGSSGTATFTTRPSGSAPLVITPDVLNRLDVPVRVTLTPAKGATVWSGVAAPSDVRALLGQSAVTRVTGVEVSDWSLLATTQGKGEVAGMKDAEVWVDTTSSRTAQTVTIRQEDAPQTLVAKSSGGAIEQVQMTWQRKDWFVKAVVTACLGLVLVVVGPLLMRVRRRPSDALPEEAFE